MPFFSKMLTSRRMIREVSRERSWRINPEWVGFGLNLWSYFLKVEIFALVNTTHHLVAPTETNCQTVTAQWVWLVANQCLFWKDRANCQPKSAQWASLVAKRRRNSPETSLSRGGRTLIILFSFFWQRFLHLLGPRVQPLFREVVIYVHIFPGSQTHNAARAFIPGMVFAFFQVKRFFFLRRPLTAEIRIAWAFVVLKKRFSCWWWSSRCQEHDQIGSLANSWTSHRAPGCHD